MRSIFLAHTERSAISISESASMRKTDIKNGRCKRQTRKTVLFYCEGADDKAFLDFLKATFADNPAVRVTVKENHGKGADGVLRGALRQPSSDRTVCMYDTDTGVNSEMKRIAERQGMIIVENDPCLEALLLLILEKKEYPGKTTSFFKRRFESEYLDEKQRKDKHRYESIFPKKLLLREMERCRNLQILIDAVRGVSVENVPVGH